MHGAMKFNTKTKLSGGRDDLCVAKHGVNIKFIRALIPQFSAGKVYNADESDLVYCVFLSTTYLMKI